MEDAANARPLTPRADVLIHEFMASASPSMKKSRVVAIVTGGVRGLTVTVWYESETGQRTLIADQPADSVAAAEAIANEHATRLGVPLHDVELVHR